MKKIIIIMGQPASGKTTLATVLAEQLRNKVNIKIIHGDHLANISYGCTYTEEEMDIKYKNMVSIIENMLALDEMLIVDDFFKRKEDYDQIYMLAQNNKVKIITFLVYCTLEERITRDGFRYLGKSLGEKRMVEYEEKYGKLSESIKVDKIFDTSCMGINEIAKQMEKVVIEENGDFYFSKA